MRLTRRYRFSASHRLYSDALTESENRAIYGKCANPFGHGHDYALDVSVRGPLEERTGRIVDLEILDELVQDAILAPMDHRNLNADLEEFRAGDFVPTTENLVLVVRDRLVRAWGSRFGAFQHVGLDKIRIEETKRNIFEISA